MAGQKHSFAENVSVIFVRKVNIKTICCVSVLAIICLKRIHYLCAIQTRICSMYPYETVAGWCYPIPAVAWQCEEIRQRTSSLTTPQRLY